MRHSWRPLAKAMTRKAFLNKQSLSLDKNYSHKAGKVTDNSPPMYRFQETLPRLPVPVLEETVAKYLRSVKAIATLHQYEHTENAVREFISPGGKGRELQKRLTEKASDPKTKNWVYEWWNESAYMAYRDPVVPYVSYFYSYKDDEALVLPSKRAARIITAALVFKDQVDSKTLEPEYMHKKPLCMDLYRFMFNCCRIPKKGVDETVNYDPEGLDYIVVLRKNRFFKVPYQVNGVRASTADFEAVIDNIYALADHEPSGPAVGALTSENRDKWAEYRDLLVSFNPKNAENLDIIEKSAFVVCLDEQSPVSKEDRAHQYWHGDGQNRFYDKPLQFIICDNGAAGFMGEHSMMDGTQTHRLSNYVNDVIVNKKIAFNQEKMVPVQLEELVFKVNSDVSDAIGESIKDFAHEINQHELAVLSYQKYGKNLIKQFKISPDAYVQMLIQLAYFRLHGVSRPTYESASTRGFILGRTETCRSVSRESVAFCKTFNDPRASPEKKIIAARKAFVSHVNYISDASDGRGVDRHFFGLKRLIGADEELPEIFKDPMFIYSSSWYLSTSQLSSEYYNGYGWSQVIDDGFGCAYMINANSIQINVVSKGNGSEKFKQCLEDAADELASLFSNEIKSKL